jgi:glycosyltransferase involved in cell wall biosynthesis
VIVIVVKPYVGFPDGTAATSRVAAYARGLAAAGEEARVILLGPSEQDAATAMNTEVRGVHQGIAFEYTSVSTIKNPSFPIRRWRVLSSMLAARRRIHELHAQSGVDAILLYSGAPSAGWFFSRVSRSIGATYVLDLAEMPYHSVKPEAARVARQERYGRGFLSRFDLVVAISRYLADYARPYLRPGAEALVLPIMVACDEYRPDRLPAADPRLVVYAGMLNERKDGVTTLMTAFSLIESDFPDVHLRLVGDSDDGCVSNVPAFRSAATELGIADRVEFTGQVRRADVPGHLADASVLVLARPSSQQADAGFPTKLGEYLASGRPVAVTRTSDIAEYLTDGEDAYLIPPDDVTALADKLRAVLGDAHATAVGAAGQRVAQEHFDFRASGRILAEAIIRARRGRT